MDVTAWAPPRYANEGVYGVGRRPSRADRAQPDPAAIAEWQQRQDRAHAVYDRTPSHIADCERRGILPGGHS